MEIASLKTFVAVVETGSFTAAGKRLKVSQSAISQQIRQLETSLGAALFTRHARKVTLTQPGDVLLPYARQILSKVDEARAVVSDFEGMGRGRVAIGAGGAVCHHILPALLDEFSTRFGKIEIQVISGYSTEVLRHTLEGSVDIGLLILPVDETGIVATELGRDELFAIAPRGHAWEKLAQVRAKDFQGERLVAYDRGSHTFKIVERFLLEAGVLPSIAMEIDDLEAVKRMVGVGLGVSIVAGWVLRAEAERKGLVARPLAPSRLYRSWGLIRRANEAPTASHKGFVSVCRSLFPQLLDYRPPNE